MRCFIIICLSLFFFTESICQLQIRPLLLGEKLPDIPFGHFINQPKQKLSVSNMKGKLLILDFWDIWCTACISSMPKLDSLQKKFGAQIQIILITKNNQKEVEKIFSKVKIKRPDLPMVVDDKIFQKMFPHNTVPHHVWIDKNGRVKFITDGYNTSAENIQAVLNNQEIKLHYKNELEDFDPTQPLWYEGNMRLSSHLQYYSFFMDRIDEFGGSYYQIPFTDSVKKRVGIKVVNMPILFFYKVAYADCIPDGWFDESSKELLNNRVILETKDTASLKRPKNSLEKDYWAEKNIFSYELNVPANKSEDIFSIMKQDLDNFFSYKSSIETKKTKCLILVKTDQGDKIKSKGGDVSINDVNGITQLRNVSISSFVRLLNYLNDSPHAMPIIDGTKYASSIDMDISANLNDLPSLLKQLNSYGLDLIEKVEEIPMLIVKDK